MSRSRPALHLAKSPLVIVLAQIRFSPVLSLGTKYIAELQERLRADYPRFSPVETRGIQLGPETKLAHSKHWVLSSKDESVCISLAENFVTLSTSKYETFERFISELKKILEDISEVLKVSQAERIGLRYVDLVRLKPGEVFSQYFKERLLGFESEDVAAKESLNQLQFIAETNWGKLAIRCTETMDGLCLPKDLSNIPLSYEDGPQHEGTDLEPGEKIRLLDFDHYSDISRDFVVSDLIETMWRLHDNCDAAFRNSVTNYALTQWGKESAES